MKTPDGSPTALRRTDWIWAGLIALLAFIPRIAAFPISNLNTHAARDLTRALRMIRGEEYPLSGPELYFGGAVPGNFYYYLQAIPLFVWSHPYATAIWIVLLNSAAAGIAYVAARMIASRLVAVATGIGFACFPLAVVEGLYLWNPSYLPFLNAVAFWGFSYWLTRRKGWGLVVMLSAALLAMQVHLSAYVLLATGLIVLAFLAVRGWMQGQSMEVALRGVAGSHLILPFLVTLPFVLPYIWLRGHLLFLDLAPPNATPEASRVFSVQTNPYAWEAYIKAFAFMDDSDTMQEFRHFPRFLGALERDHPGAAFLVNGWVQPISIVCALLFGLAGVALLLIAAFFPTASRVHAAALKLSGLAPITARPVAIGLLSWLAIPLVVLLQMTGPDPDAPVGIPTRYIVILFPVAMTVLGLGIAGLYRAIPDRMGLRYLPIGFFALTQLAHAYLLCAFIWFGYSTYGVFDGLFAPNYTKPLFVQAQVSRVLAQEYDATIEDLRERLLTDSNFSELAAEQYLEFALFQGHGADRAGAPKDHWFYFYDTTRGSADPPPVILDSGELLAVHEFGPFRLLVLLRPEGNTPIVWPRAQLESPMVY